MTENIQADKIWLRLDVHLKIMIEYTVCGLKAAIHNRSREWHGK